MATTLPHPRSFNDIAIKGDYKPATKYKGQPAISFSDEEIINLSARFVCTIVGRFTKGRPCLISIHKAFERIAFENEFIVSLLDESHILINFEYENDFLRCLLRKYWKINGFILKVFRWTHDFDPNIDSPLIPVWISLEGLPIHFFDSLALYSIANLIGKPLKTDAATANLSRPSIARICVEVDTSEELPHGVWIHLGQLTFHQPIHYEDHPGYCPSCKSFGHKKCKKATKSSKWVVKELPGTGNTALAVAVPLLQTVDTTLKLVAKQVDGQNQDGANENDTTSVETNSPAQVETNLIQSDQKSEAINLEQILEPGAETLEIDHEVQSASDTYTSYSILSDLCSWFRTFWWLIDLSCNLAGNTSQGRVCSLDSVRTSIAQCARVCAF
ncbi:unnamed protein product [Cuscuta campestris]|uniref:DUF4283 domain-containing protein n=1 Tax=Cuscuta campestris TaxID=132261 RepID=A0A484N5T1_9ASTE|nr:unnamed protein product [Cuscuta campestris]